ncbi:MAG: methyltransferase [Asgard group archaeon]|nr:methyltransferase [Asgard group archaeon]
MVRYIFPKYEIKLEIPEDVYFPEEDTFLILNSIEIIEDYRFLLEIGGGSGIISIVLAHRNPKLRCLITDISLSSVKTIYKNSRLNHLEKQIDAVCMDKMQALRQFCPDIIIWNPPYLPSDEDTDSFSFEDKKMLIGGKKGYEEVYELFKYLKQNKIRTSFYTLFSSLAWSKEDLHDIEDTGFSVQIIDEINMFFEKLYLVKSELSDTDA